MCVCVCKEYQEKKLMYTKHVFALQIALRSMKSVELRVGGSVEPPNVDISVVSYCMCVYTSLLFTQCFLL